MVAGSARPAAELTPAATHKKKIGLTMNQNTRPAGWFQIWARLCVLAFTFWIGSSVAQSPAGVYYVHNDHLNTPRAITNQAGQTVWSWDNTDPFGANAPNENPGGLGTFTCNLRLPGQYFDKETGLHYNYFRDYDPSIGRYIQSDPIGLKGGLNTYAYVNGSPLSLVDAMGLQSSQGSNGRTPQQPRPEPAPSTIREGIQGQADYVQCVENATSASAIVAACVAAITTRSIPITAAAFFAGAFAGQFAGEAFICKPNPASNSNDAHGRATP
jgi:RHS repeat-associated protein